MAYENEAEEASGLLALARQTHEAHVNAAKEKAAAILAQAQDEASEILSNAREEFTSLETKISQHREFESRYRNALSTYLAELLDEINQSDDFIAPVAAAVIEPSVFEVEEPELVEVVAEPPFEEAEELSIEKEAEEEAVEDEVLSEVIEEAAAEEVNEEVASYDDIPSFAEGDAPVPAFAGDEVLVPTFVDSEEDSTGGELPEAPETLDSFASGAVEIEALEQEINEHHRETDEEIRVFDELIAGEPKPATGSVAAQAPIFEDGVAEEEKGARGFFGFKKS